MKKITNAHICQIVDNQVIPIFGDIIFDDKIIDINKEGNTKNYNDIEEVYDAEGRVITIPNVNFHDHIYSRLAKGLSITGSMEGFVNILESLWWKLDLLLDLDMVKASAQYAAIESIKNGVTYIFDHHASPSYAKKSLSTIADVLRECNIRGNLCFEISDRNGKDLSNDSIAESIEFINQQDENIKTLLGLHASFTVDDSTLSKVSEIVNSNNLGIHIHLCEDKADRDESISKYNEAPLERLIKFNLLNNKSILAHGNHLTDAEYKKIEQSGSAIVYNPESNLNNNVGIAEYQTAPNNIPILCGTDGMHSKPFQSFNKLFLLARNQNNKVDDLFTWMNKIYFDQIKFVKKFFPDFTSLNIGDRADFIMWDYVPPTPINDNNFLGHYIYAIVESQVKSVLQNGDYLLKYFNLCTIDEQKFRDNIKSMGNKLVEKFNQS